MLLVSLAVSSSLLVSLVLALPEPEAGLGAEHVITLSRCLYCVVHHHRYHHGVLRQDEAWRVVRDHG